jgi:hypothetical protein
VLGWALRQEGGRTKEFPFLFVNTR